MICCWTDCIASHLFGVVNISLHSCFIHSCRLFTTTCSIIENAKSENQTIYTFNKLASVVCTFMKRLLKMSLKIILLCIISCQIWFRQALILSYRRESDKLIYWILSFWSVEKPLTPLSQICIISSLRSVPCWNSLIHIFFANEIFRYLPVMLAGELPWDQ